MKTWRATWRLITYRPGLFLGHAAAVMVLFLGSQAMGLLLREFFDMLSGQAPVNFGFWTLAALVAGAGLVRIVASFGIVATGISFVFTGAALMQSNMLAHVLDLPGAAAIRSSAGESISRFRGDVDELRELPLVICDIFGLVVFSIVAVVIMSRTDARITAMAMGPLFVVIFVSNAASRRIQRLRKAAREATGRVTGHIGEMFGSVQAIKAACAEQTVTGHFRSLNAVRSQTALRDRLFHQILISIFRNTVAIGTGLILLLAAGSMREGTFTVGDLTLFVYYLGTIADMMWNIGSVLARFKQAGISIDRMTAFMDGASDDAIVRHRPVYLHHNAPPAEPPAARDRLERLTATGLTSRYKDTGRGIEDIDMDLPRGSFTVVVGRIGSGKTTLLRAFLGLLPRQAGEIRWNGEPVTDPATFLVPPRVAYTPQVPWLFSASLRENLLMGLEAGDDEMREAVRSAVLEDDLAELADGLGTMIGPKGVKLSGGQAQRAAAARMFVRRPELLVFDDLSSALDVETESVLWQRVFDHADSTCLVVSHRRPVLRRADRILVLSHGRLAAVGRLDELLENSEEMRNLWREEITS